MNEDLEPQAEKSELAVQSERFLVGVETQFAAQIGAQIEFSHYQKTLAQHMFLKITTALDAAEKKRGNNNPLSYEWGNVNMPKLALDAVHTVALGLDALIENHISPIPRKNNLLGKYDISLQVGYAGKDFYRRELAIEKPVDVIYHLVHKSDTFKPLMKSSKNDVEGYEFEVSNPFSRGEVVGGFGYIVYAETTKNKLVIVDMDAFKKAEDAAAGDTFWKKHKMEMQYKTVVHRVTAKIPIDPKKATLTYSYEYVEGQEREPVEDQVIGEIAANANKDAIDLTDQTKLVPEKPKRASRKKKEEPKAEKKQKPGEPSEEDLKADAEASAKKGPGY